MMVAVDSVDKHRRRKWEEEEGSVNEKAPDSAWMWRIKRLTREATAKPASQDKFAQALKGTRRFIFPVNLSTRRIGDRT